MNWKKAKEEKQLSLQRREDYCVYRLPGGQARTSHSQLKPSLAQIQAWRRQMLQEEDPTIQLMMLDQIKRYNG